jgi:hypothetical protein
MGHFGSKKGLKMNKIITVFLLFTGLNTHASIKMTSQYDTINSKCAICREMPIEVPEVLVYFDDGLKVDLVNSDGVIAHLDVDDNNNAYKIFNNGESVLLSIKDDRIEMTLKPMDQAAISLTLVQ